MGEYFSYDHRRIRAKIVAVYDGDTCTAVFKQLVDKGPIIQYRIRLAGIDTPELHPRLNLIGREKIISNANRSKLAVQEKILGKIVILECGGFDKYGRILATIWIDRMNLNEWLIKNGYAVRYDGGKKEDETNEIS